MKQLLRRRVSKLWNPRMWCLYRSLQSYLVLFWGSWVLKCFQTKAKILKFSSYWDSSSKTSVSYIFQQCILILWRCINANIFLTLTSVIICWVVTSISWEIIHMIKIRWKLHLNHLGSKSTLKYTGYNWGNQNRVAKKVIWDKPRLVECV